MKQAVELYADAPINLQHAPIRRPSPDEALEKS
jgi:hypothetical protein